MKISVAMATYNGEKYIKEQLESILNQLGKDDEVVVSDDGSTDKTLDIVKSLKDKRIKIIKGPRKGVKQNFSNAIKHCTGRYIFLADQDDVWMPNKLERVLKVFENERCSCVVHDAEVFESRTGKIIEPSFFAWRKSGGGIWKNIWRNTYIGCCMAFSDDMKKYILPIPDDINMHDQWIGIMCEKHGKSAFLKERLVRYRRHEGNQSEMKHGGVGEMIGKRFRLVRELGRRR
ncbi:glycosyltransferase family 2 protein [Candidatus Saccharibacteria bacterium]|nr:glycosyltransferase family 2 protein [Candidatus Saccharibacteria bacterium]